jgi:high-affinity nickel-transport protein
LGALTAVNIAAWLWALIGFHDSPLLLGTAVVAYTFGLRHGFDADHIAAIDNVMRKLMWEGQKPVAVGLSFALGHSTIVVALAILTALSATTLADHYSTLKDAGRLIGTGISAFFLFAVAAANLLVFVHISKALQTARRGENLVEGGMDKFLERRGLFCNIFRNLLGLVGRSWHMYPVGLLFGLGFDTATEVGLLGIAAHQASHGLAMWPILIFPALFTAGMSLMDTVNGVLMLGAYASASPIRVLHYNLIVTFVTATTALIVGGIEFLGLLGEKIGLGAHFTGLLNTALDNFSMLGCAIVALFIVSWFAAILINRPGTTATSALKAARTAQMDVEVR